jgi:putative peptidoglycan lipid II flippase
MSSQVTDVEHGRRRLQAQTSESLTRVAFTTVPATLAFLALPDQIVGLLYQTGKFDAATTLAVAAPLAAAGTGLLANAGVRVLASAFYALGDTSTPARLAVVRVACSIGLSYALMLRYGVVGLAAGSAIGGWFEAFLLAGRARRRLGGLGLPAGRWGKIFLSAVVAAAAGVAIKIALPGSAMHLRAVAALAGFGLAYLAVAWALGVPDVRRPFAAVGRRLRK